MKKLIAVLAVFVMLMGVTALTVTADEPEFPPHGHMLVLGIEFGENDEVSYRKCVDLANNQALKLNAHHDHIHFGTAGDALRAAGHYPIPTTPLSNIDNCAHFAELFGPPTK